MSDDEADPELLALLRQHLQGPIQVSQEPETGVLEGAEHVCDEAIDVMLDMRATKNAAALIYQQMQDKGYSTANWHEHEMHPKTQDEAAVAFIFTMDLLNFSFWSAVSDEQERFAVEHRGKRWTGYGSLVASLQRALEEDIPITDPHYWHDESACTLDSLKYIFRSCTDEEMPMLEERLAVLREAAQVLYERYNCSFVNCIEASDGSAAAFVNLLARDFPSFRDEFQTEGRRRPVRFLKRAQILAADLWACFDGKAWGAFYDIDKLTMFADYRVPQILASLGCIGYSPPLQARITGRELLESGTRWEVQIRAASIWCVELIKREIQRQHPETKVNAILIDFFLYDTMKQLEAQGKETMPHHRTRSIYY